MVRWMFKELALVLAATIMSEFMVKHGRRQAHSAITLCETGLFL
jgi:hypothetical protein